MNRIVRLRTSVVILAVVVSSSVCYAQSESRLTVGAALPAILDSLYPPAAPMPVYLIKMHEMSTPLSGIGSDAMEGDLDNARSQFEVFRQKYSEVATLVPEWAGLFPLGPVDELGAALQAGTPEKLMPALSAIGAVCNDCHYRFMPATQQRYHWDDFGRITIPDPLSGQDFPFAQFMLVIESDMSGIGIDAKQGQLEPARAHARGLRARMSALREACATCHDTERHYFVDSTVFSAIDAVNSALSETPPRMDAVGGSLKQIGEESCFKCHLVHIPAAYSKK